MLVLVAVASRHGATAEIADAIAERLGVRRIGADVCRIEDCAGVDGYGAVILGSAVYAGSWLPSARQFVEAHAAELAARPV
jgi:menaquinone-dependent protoporphyrinogen oxidase